MAFPLATGFNNHHPPFAPLPGDLALTAALVSGVDTST